MEKLDRAQKCSILGPQNMGLEGLGPLAPNPQIRAWTRILLAKARHCSH